MRAWCGGMTCVSSVFRFFLLRRRLMCRSQIQRYIETYLFLWTSLRFSLDGVFVSLDSSSACVGVRQLRSPREEIRKHLHGDDN